MSLNSLIVYSGSQQQRPRCDFESASLEGCIQSAICTTKSGEKIVYIGMRTPNATLTILASTYNVFEHVRKAPGLFAANKVALLIRLSLTNLDSAIIRALEALSNGKEVRDRPAIKIMIGCFLF